MDLANLLQGSAPASKSYSETYGKRAAPPSPPVEERKCSLPSISTLLENADGHAASEFTPITHSQTYTHAIQSVNVQAHRHEPTTPAMTASICLPHHHSVQALASVSTAADTRTPPSSLSAKLPPSPQATHTAPPSPPRTQPTSPAALDPTPRQHQAYPPTPHPSRPPHPIRPCTTPVHQQAHSPRQPLSSTSLSHTPQLQVQLQAQRQLQPPPQVQVQLHQLLPPPTPSPPSPQPGNTTTTSLRPQRPPGNQPTTAISAAPATRHSRAPPPSVFTRTRIQARNPSAAHMPAVARPSLSAVI